MPDSAYHPTLTDTDPVPLTISLCLSLQLGLSLERFLMFKIMYKTSVKLGHNA